MKAGLAHHRVLQEIYLRKYENKLTRDKETYWIQRYSLGRIETEQIIKYCRHMEKKFEVNWQAYEEQLEKFLTQKSQGDFRDWVQRTNETGDVVWTNTQTMKSQTEHPGHKIF